MALIVEDGTGLLNSNSYNSLDELKAYALARGATLPADDEDIEVLAIQATDYTESLRDKYQGKRVSRTQSLQWPRIGVVLDDEEIPANEIPIELKNGHAQATIEAYTTDLMPNASAAVKKEKVDVIEVEYADSSTSSFGLTKVDSILEPLFSYSSGFSLRSQRV